MSFIKSNGKIERESNIELLRIVLMLMIIMYHLVVHGCHFRAMASNEYISNSNDIMLALLTSFTAIAVNCFIFISGYYGIKFKVKTLISFILQAIFYSTTMYIFYNVLLNDNFSIYYFSVSFFPITFNFWWFLNAFLGVYILSPFINKGIEYLNNYLILGLIIILIYLEAPYLFWGHNSYSIHGLDVYTLLVVYIVARFCNKVKLEIANPFRMYLIIISVIFIFVYTCLKLDLQGLGWRITAYNSVLVIIGAGAFFYGFKKINVRSSIINKIAPLTFGVYLIHDYGTSQRQLISLVEKINGAINNPFILFFALIALTILIFVICSSIEKLRQVIMNPAIEIISNKISRFIEQKQHYIKNTLAPKWRIDNNN
ncbi:MAG: hypothetical protein RL662_1828 [Bacteroidota bacterium]|jgi:hypothetical protein